MKDKLAIALISTTAGILQLLINSFFIMLILGAITTLDLAYSQVFLGALGLQFVTSVVSSQVQATFRTND